MHTETEETPALMRPNSYPLTILMALNRLNRHIYGGTVPPAVVAKRRKANKRAKAQRKVNRHA